MANLEYRFHIPSSKLPWQAGKARFFSIGDTSYKHLFLPIVMLIFRVLQFHKAILCAMFCWSIIAEPKEKQPKTLRLCDFSIAPSLAKAYFSDPYSDDVGVVPWLQFPIIPATGGGIVCLVTFRWFWTLNPTTTCFFLGWVVFFPEQREQDIWFLGSKSRNIQKYLGCLVL